MIMILSSVSLVLMLGTNVLGSHSRCVLCLVPYPDEVYRLGN